MMLNSIIRKSQFSNYFYSIYISRTAEIINEIKKNYDYKIYLITTGIRTYEDQNPDQDIRYAKDIIRRVKVTTEYSEN